MRNTRKELVELSDSNGCFLAHVNSLCAAEHLRRGAIVTQRVGGRITRLKLLPPAPPPSDSPTSPATITLRDVLANVGLPCSEWDDPRHGSHIHYLSAGRQAAARDKLAEFAPVGVSGHPGRIRPGLLDRLQLVDALPDPYPYDFA